MSMIKRYLEANIDKISDEELMKLGYDEEEIKELRDSFSDN